VLLFEYTQTAMVTFQAIVCVNSFDGYILLAYPTVTCFEGQHIVAFIVALLVLFLYLLGLPSMLLWYLYRHRAVLSSDWRVAHSFGYIYQSFRAPVYYSGIIWMFVLCFQGLSFALDIEGATAVAVVIYGLFAIFLFALRPFKQLWVNLVGGIMMIFAVIVRVFMYINVDPNVYLDTAIAFIVFSIVTALFVVLYPIVMGVLEQQRRRRDAKEFRRQRDESIKTWRPIFGFANNNLSLIDPNVYSASDEVRFSNPAFNGWYDLPMEQKYANPLFAEYEEIFPLETYIAATTPTTPTAGHLESVAGGTGTGAAGDFSNGTAEMI
jgi:hypothetical protein